MAIAVNDLLAFNNVETTDILQGIVELPFLKPVAYIAGLTFSNKYEDYLKGQRGSIVSIRKLGKGTVKKVKATAANALDFAHAETADDIEFINIDDVVSRSEKIYEAVDVARQSKTGASKAELVLLEVVEGVQENISTYLQRSLPYVLDVGLDYRNAKNKIIDAMGKVEKPNVLMASKEFYNTLLKLVTTGDFIANPRETAIRTGIVGHILGLNVVVDYNLTTEEFIIYDYEKFPVFVIFEEFDIVNAIDFKGSYARAQMLSGGGRTPTTLNTQGLWGVKYISDEENAITITFNLATNSSDEFDNFTEKILKGTKVVKPSNPEALNGKAFKGWFTTSSGSTAFDFDAELSQATTVYAQWEA